MAKNPKKPYNPHPAKVKQAQNALILAKGNQAQAARDSGISLATIQRYVKSGIIDPTLVIDGADTFEGLAQIAADRNAKLAETMMGTAEKAVRQVDARIVDASAKDAAIVAGVMIEKARLVAGQSTQKIEIDIRDPLAVLERHGLISETVVDAEVVEEIEGPH